MLLLPHNFPQAQRGQALPLGLAFMLAITLLMLILFNTGEMTTEKSQVANTADAAVYSGLVWQARSLNFQSYTNRAMVANQVSIAQFVSLGSWTQYGRISARNLDATIGSIPIVAPFTSALVEVMTAIEDAVRALAELAIPVIDGVTSVLSVVQEAVFIASYAATPEVVNTIVKANDARYRAFSTYSIAATVLNARDWQALTTRHSDDDEGMERKTEVINASRDEFSADRGWDSVPGLPDKIFIAPLVSFSIVKEGETRLVQDGGDWEWRGKDGLSLHLKSPGPDPGELPLGWGSNYAEGDGACGGGACSNWFERNDLAEQLADAEAESLSGYNGVKSYRSLADLSSDNRDPRLQLHIEVDVANADVRTAEKITGLGSPSPANGGVQYGMDPGKFYTEDVYAGNDIASISAGEVFFKRPVLSDGGRLFVDGEPKEEFANLFNPYWDVRLIEVTENQRLIAWALRSPGLAAGVAVEDLAEYIDIDAGELESFIDLSDTALDGLEDGSFIDSIGELPSVGELPIFGGG